MYEDNGWNSVTGEQLDGFLTQVNPIDGKHKCSAQTSQVAWRALPFYDSVALIRIRDAAWTPSHLSIYYLTDKGALFRLNGTSPPIHEINAKAPIKITEQNVLDYLRFFCFFVRGEKGPFLIAESMDDPNMPKNMDDSTRSVVANTIRPASYEGRNDKDHYMCDGVVFYDNAMFIATFSVHPTGMIEMLSDEAIALDLPVRVDCPIA